MPKNGLQLIEAERRRQVEDEGFSAEHDAKLRRGNLALAAVAYAAKAVKDIDYHNRSGGLEAAIRLWPWQPSDYRPTPNDPIRELVKAGALIAAEIDKLLAAGVVTKER